MDHQAGADRGGNPFQQLEEDGTLIGGIGRIAIGVGKVSIDAAPFESGISLDEREEFRGLLMPDAGAAHAGVDLDVHLRLEARLRGRGGERLRFVERVQGHIKSQGQRSGKFARKGRTKQQDVGVMADLAQVRGFSDIRHRETIDAGLKQARGDLGHAVAVGVGLYHGDVTHVGREGLLDATDVAIDGRQVDLDPSPRGGSV